MTTPADRFKGWIDGLSESWKDRLRGWMASWLLKGIEDTFEDLEGKPREGLFAILDELIASPDTPSTIKPVLEKIRGHQSPAWFVTILIMLGAIIGSTVLAQFAPSLSALRYAAQRFAKMYRLDPATITRIWLRDKEGYEELWADLMDQGWDEERIAVAKELAKIIPPLADMVRFADFSAFDPEVIERWREFYDAPGFITEPFKLLGIFNEPPRDWANKYWFSHYVQPGRYELGEMFRRTESWRIGATPEDAAKLAELGVTEDDLTLAYRTMAYSEFWQKRLIELAKAIPTRVDVRRWWDMRTIDETELRSLYQRQGYFGKDLDNYVLWTKVYVAFPDLIARWTKGWITEAEVKSELTALGMPAARVDEMIETKKKAVAGEQAEEGKALTKSEIYKGVRMSKITREEGLELLGDMNYDEETADLLLATNVPVDEEDVVVKERELTKADIIKGLKTEVLTEPQAHDRLVELRYTPDDADFLIKIFLATITPPVDPRAKEASKADIVLAVKKGLITPEDAYLMLQDIDFTPEASEFILMVKAEVSPFSPVNFAEFKDLTQKYRKAAGMAAKPVPEELKKAAEEVVKLTAEVKSLKEAVEAEERGLVKEEVLPEAATAKLEELRVALHRAEANLFAAKTNYDSLVAQWRYGG